jgi:hypothetical protein
MKDEAVGPCLDKTKSPRSAIDVEENRRGGSPAEAQ